MFTILPAAPYFSYSPPRQVRTVHWIRWQERASLLQLPALDGAELPFSASSSAADKKIHQLQFDGQCSSLNSSEFENVGKSGKLRKKSLFDRPSKIEDQSRFVSRTFLAFARARSLKGPSGLAPDATVSTSSATSLPLFMPAHTHCIGDSHASWVFR